MSRLSISKLKSPALPTPASTSRSGLREIFEDRFRAVLPAAREGEQQCLSGNRWEGNAILIVIDASLDSSGLNYFKIVVPRVRRFYHEYVKPGEINSFGALAALSPEDARLRGIINNGRVWRVAIDVSDIFNRIKEREGFNTDMDALRYWARHTSYEEWRKDEIGRINGVGLITFQYLRMQAGVDTSMPDKIIKRVVEREFGIHARDDIEFIGKMEELSRATGYSQLLLCWAIWLREANIDISLMSRMFELDSSIQSSHLNLNLK